MRERLQIILFILALILSANTYSISVFTENKGQLIDMQGNPVMDILFINKNQNLYTYLWGNKISYVQVNDDELDALEELEEEIEHMADGAEKITVKYFLRGFFFQRIFNFPRFSIIG